VVFFRYIFCKVVDVLSVPCWCSTGHVKKALTIVSILVYLNVHETVIFGFLIS
jgi:hypothetical protein